MTAEVLSVNRDTQEEESNIFTQTVEEKRRTDEAERAMSASLLKVERYKQQKTSEAGTEMAHTALNSMGQGLIPSALMTILTGLTSIILFSVHFLST